MLTMKNALARPEIIDGRAVLAIDSLMDPKSFAQARLAQLLNECGYLVHADGRVEPWRLEGTLEAEGRVSLYGPDFPSRPLLERLEMDESAAALDALRHWASARQALAGRVDAVPAPIPGGALLDDDGACLFLPERLVRRALDARGPEFSLENWQRWNHPDLYGADADTYALGTLSFRLFCGEAPFAGASSDEVYAEMRYAPAPSIRFHNPGLRDGIAALIDSAIRPPPNRAAPNARTSRRLAAAAAPAARLAAPAAAASTAATPAAAASVAAAPAAEASAARASANAAAPAGETVKTAEGKTKTADGTGSSANPTASTPLLSFSALLEALGPAASGGPDKFQTTVSAETAEKIAKDQNRYRKRKKFGVFKRLAEKNNTKLTIAAVAFIAVILLTRSIQQSRADRPTTIGMTPRTVVETYYGAFNSLDHELMEACAVKPAGKGDIESTMNIFVIAKVRMAYESRESHLAPEAWLAEGSPEVTAAVYGVSDVKIAVVDADDSDGRTSFLVDYRFWRPGDVEPGSSQVDPTKAANEVGSPAPVSQLRQDRVYLTKDKDLWRIAQLDRQVVGGE